VDEVGEVIEGGCEYGWDFVEEDSDPSASDGYSHGTEVAGLIAAKTNNELGIASISNNKAQIMALRVADNGYIEAENIARAIYFAVNNGADIINMSFGGPAYSVRIKEALKYAQGQGVILVAAAGNYALNLDTDPFYPASYDLANIITVAAHDQSDRLAYFSSFSSNVVDLAAPGQQILTTSGNSYLQVNGTSAAAPLVSAALVNYNNATELQEAIGSSSELSGYVSGGKMLRFEGSKEGAEEEEEVVDEEVVEEEVVDEEVATEEEEEIVEEDEAIDKGRGEIELQEVSGDFAVRRLKDTRFAGRVK
jgi:subtilisin family serine protease